MMPRVKLLSQAAAAIGIVVVLACDVQAAPLSGVVTKQPAFPPGLSWSVMTETTEGFKPKYARAPEDARLSRVGSLLWRSEIDAYRMANKDAPVFMLTSVAQLPDKTVTASLIDLPLDVDRCERPADGRKVVDMFSKCLLRLAVTTSSETEILELADVCYLNIDNDRSTPLSQNHTEFSYQPASNTVFLRVVQYGKVVAACSRAIRLSR